MFKKFLAKLIRKYERRKSEKAKIISEQTKGESTQPKTDKTIVMNRDLFFKQIDERKSDHETKTDLPFADIHPGNTNDIPFDSDNPDITKITDITDVEGTTKISEIS